MIPKELVDLGLYAAEGFLGVCMLNAAEYFIIRGCVDEWSNKRLEAFRTRMYSSKIPKVAKYLLLGGTYQAIDSEAIKREKIRLEAIEELRSKGNLQSTSQCF